MNFRFFDDLGGLAPESSQEFRFREGNIQQNITQQRLLKFFGKFT